MKTEAADDGGNTITAGRGSGSITRKITVMGRTNWRAAPFVFFSPPSSKLMVHVRSCGYQKRDVHTACSASRGAAFCTCRRCTQVVARPSWSSSPVMTKHGQRRLSRARHSNAPSCERRAWSDHRNRSACGRSDASPARRSSPCPSCTG